MAPAVQRSCFVVGASPREVYDVVVDFAAYPRLFPEIKSVRVVDTAGTKVRVEFGSQVVIPVRYVLDLVCDPETPSVEWTYVEGEVVKDSRGGWRFAPEGDGTRVDYRVSLEVSAPVPGFILRRVTDALVSASIPAMFESLRREVARRKQRQR